MRRAKLLVLLCTLVIATPAAARMYEWVNPATGRAQLSGNPPAWYRGTVAGPRIRVYENGALVDDTAIRLSAEDNGALREFAMAKAEESRQLEALRQLELATQRETAMQSARREEAERLAAAQQRREADAASSAQPEATAGEAGSGSTAAAEAPEVLDAQTIERLKALISAFDRIP